MVFNVRNIRYFIPKTLWVAGVFLVGTVVSCHVEHKKPKAIVVVVVDQLRVDYLSRFQNVFSDSGFKRLMKEGAVFSNCFYRQATTHTSPGHATILSGLFPTSHGIIANYWFDRKLGRRVYAAEDTLSPVLLREELTKTNGRSPVRMQSMNINDVIKQSDNHSKIFSVSNKDRSAIFLGGLKPDGAYWFMKDRGGVYSSTYYTERLPDWILEFNRSNPSDKYFGRSWNCAVEESDYKALCTDSYAFADSPFDHAGFPYLLIGSDSLQPDQKYYSRLYETPFATDLLLDFVEALLKHEKIGSDESTDVLCISMSANDYVGHSFGPGSREVMDMTLRTDRQLGRLFSMVQSAMPATDVLWILTSDHGIAPLPETSDGIRVRPAKVKAVVEKLMIEKYGKLEFTNNYVSSVQYPNLYFNDALLEEKKIDKEEAGVYISQSLVQKMQGIEAVFTSSMLKLDKGTSDSLLEAARVGFVNRTSGDLVVLLKPFSIWSSKEGGAEHGSAYPYDTHVPLIIMGDQWIRAGTYADRCSPADIAPTLASILSLNTSYRFDGRILREALLPSPTSPEE